MSSELLEYCLLDLGNERFQQRIAHQRQFTLNLLQCPNLKCKTVS